MAMLEFEAFKDKYQDKYPSIVRDWEKDLDYILAFYQYPYEIRRMLSTTNLIESVNSKIRKAQVCHGLLMARGYFLMMIAF